MNRVYPNGKDHLLIADMDVTAVDMRVILVDDSAVFDPATDVIGDLAAVTVGTGVSVGPCTVDDGEVSPAVDSVTVTDAPAGVQVSAAVVYAHRVSPSERWVLAWIDSAPDSSPVDLLTNGDDVDVALSDPLFRL